MEEIIVFLCNKFLGINVIGFHLTQDDETLIHMLIKHKFLTVSPNGTLIQDKNPEQVLNLDKLTLDEIQAGESQGKLECVRLYKHRSGKSLMDSKRFVEKYFADNGLTFLPPQY